LRDPVQIAQDVLIREFSAIERVTFKLNTTFDKTIEIIQGCVGRVVVMGVGKSGHVGRKIAATLASTGQPSFFVHPTEAAHGDSGMMMAGDVCLMLSHSGETEELLCIVPTISRLRLPIIVMTANPQSPLACNADVVINTHVGKEACSMNLVPTTSTTVSMALGDAVALTLMELRGFREAEFAERHPGGALGRKLVDITHKIDAVTKIGDARISMGGIQPPPKSVKIELTARCNLRCKFCALRTRKTKSVPDMTLGFFKKITTDMRYAGVEEIGLFYLGESFMAPELLAKACAWVKKELKFPWVFLTSNATNASPEHVAALMEAGLDSLKWSVNACNSEQYKEVCGGSEKQFSNACENIVAAKRVRDVHAYPTILSASSIQYDTNQRVDMDEFLDRNVRPFVDRHYWLPMYSMSMYRAKVQEDTGYVSTIGNMGRIDEDTNLPNRSPLPCWPAFTEGHVRVNGGLSACCFGADARFDMGVLDGTNFMQQWNSEEFVALREAQIRTISEGPDALVKTPCRVCVAFEGSEDSGEEAA